jgi:hypothetical protein
VTFLFPAILTQLKWARQNCRQCWTSSQNTTSRMHLKNVRSAGNGAYGDVSKCVVLWGNIVLPITLFCALANPVTLNPLSLLSSCSPQFPTTDLS